MAGSSGTRLQTPEDFDYTRTLDFLGPRSVASMEITRPDAYIRTVWLDLGSLSALRAYATAAPAPSAARVQTRPRSDALAPSDASHTRGIELLSRDARRGGAPDGAVPADARDGRRRDAGAVHATDRAPRLRETRRGPTIDADADEVRGSLAAALELPPEEVSDTAPLSTAGPSIPGDSDFAGPVTLAIIPGADGGSLTIHSAPALPDAVRRLLVTRMFDLDADLDAFSTAVSRDRVLGPLVRRQPRLRLPQLLDPFEGLVRAVLGQQVSVKGATTMVDRLVRLLGTPAPALDGVAVLGGIAMSESDGVAASGGASLRDGDGPHGRRRAGGGARELSLSRRAPSRAALPAPGVATGAVRASGSAAWRAASQSPPGRGGSPLLAFPRPVAMASAGEAALRSIGLTRAKAATLARLADAAQSGALDCVRLRSQSADDAQAALVALPGIGPWTASYVRMRALGDRDAFPLTDLGVIKALDARGVPRDRHAIVSDRWRPWRAYATLHLWQSLSTAP
jgi:3-methyladenine DNA glycosylase/8-oxoguanine DNA glycosylase